MNRISVCMIFKISPIWWICVLLILLRLLILQFHGSQVLKPKQNVSPRISPLITHPEVQGAISWLQIPSTTQVNYHIFYTKEQVTQRNVSLLLYVTDQDGGGHRAYAVLQDHSHSWADETYIILQFYNVIFGTGQWHVVTSKGKYLQVFVF